MAMIPAPRRLSRIRAPPPIPGAPRSRRPRSPPTARPARRRRPLAAQRADQVPVGELEGESRRRRGRQPVDERRREQLAHPVRVLVGAGVNLVAGGQRLALGPDRVRVEVEPVLGRGGVLASGLAEQPRHEPGRLCHPGDHDQEDELVAAAGADRMAAEEAQPAEDRGEAPGRSPCTAGSRRVPSARASRGVNASTTCPDASASPALGGEAAKALADRGRRHLLRPRLEPGANLARRARRAPAGGGGFASASRAGRAARRPCAPRRARRPARARAPAASSNASPTSLTGPAGTPAAAAARPRSRPARRPGAARSARGARRDARPGPGCPRSARRRRAPGRRARPQAPRTGGRCRRRSSAPRRPPRRSRTARCSDGRCRAAAAARRAFRYPLAWLTSAASALESRSISIRWPSPPALARGERGEDRDGRPESGDHVDQRDPDLRRLAVRGPGDRHQPRERLHERVVARHRGTRAGAEAGDRAMDEPGVRGPQHSRCRARTAPASRA